MWQIEISHPGLNKYRHIRGKDKSVVEQKAAAQQAAWAQMWLIKLEKEQQSLIKQLNHEQAKLRTLEAVKAVEELKNILQHTLGVDDTIKWETLKNKKAFQKQKPELPQPQEIPQSPLQTAPQYQPKFNFLDVLIPSREDEKIKHAQELYKTDYRYWEVQKEKILKRNSKSEKEYLKQLQLWQAEEQEFLAKQKETNEAIEKRKEQYLGKDPDAIFDYCELVLSNSKYPDYFPKEFDLDYNTETKILIVEYSLPSIDVMPTVKEVKYIQSRDELAESHLPESILNKIYDSLVYQIALRTIHELYESDVVNALDSIVFNGWVESIDKATGKQVKACILSVQANRAEFSSINLANVDPKLCFKTLKGVGSSKLHSLTPIAPVLSISREDKRFVSSYEVSDKINEFSNLAAMGWEDFEHLIREVFEKEFAQHGGEVKVTQASRDGGVDAIAFDPDPIRGGKIVIQAKRYTNTVGVSAVRDLFGTVMNEGATKGILVTTADYGPDAYEFAKGKPLTLLSGSNLLHLLEKHGHKATIDIKAAKQILAETKTT
ncbi:restriction endonuclease [Nitrosomonas sp. Is24]|uniref:restriction endonuclease n=1 Tax=Nitrosomonas sp. Is24 TaxID=3080533 RepID=UPI00294B5557|nr:restriction endonuclease [Nitrosomonas sp. Is24]MDV6342294.1 restriction endonuclease [Nitrosomonas sp. Is24]